MKCGFSSFLSPGEPGGDTGGIEIVMVRFDRALPRFGRDGIVFSCGLMVIVVLDPGSILIYFDT
jgi:hypothetical protein